MKNGIDTFLIKNNSLWLPVALFDKIYLFKLQYAEDAIRHHILFIHISFQYLHCRFSKSDENLFFTPLEYLNFIFHKITI